MRRAVLPGVLGLCLVVLAPLSRPLFGGQFAVYYSDEASRFEKYGRNFRDEFDNTWTNTQYRTGRCSYMESNSYVDNVDLAFVAGHGNYSKMWMRESEGACRFDDGDKAWGDADLEYIAFMSCKVMLMDSGWRERWKSNSANAGKPFNGLHVAAGFWTTHYNTLGQGKKEADEFAENLEDRMSVRDAWYEAVQKYRYLSGYINNKPAIFYIRPHKYESINGVGNADHRYGSADYNLDASYMR